MSEKNFARFLATFLVLVLLIPMFKIQNVNASTGNPKNEMRAAWIATITNIDMKSGMSKSAYTQWVTTTLDKLKADHFNTVIFQAKPLNDALYPSKLAPWSSYITGKKQGTNPGYDPLQIMIDEAHKRGLELHAWVNPYRVTMPSQKLSDLAAHNIARKNPGWVVKYGSQYYLNPGLPEVQEYLVSTVKELVANYDVDAVHMDDYFYPYKIQGETFKDQDAFKKYGSSFKQIEDWRRNNVNQLVKNVYNTIKATKPHVQYGISPFGIWRNKGEDSTGSDTNGMSNYDGIYADTRQWIKDGSIDYIAPQIYWSRSYKAANYSTLLDWWGREVQTYAKAHPINLYIGMADYKVGNDSDKAWSDKTELTKQVIANRANTSVKGQMHFSLRSINSNALGYAAYMKKQMYHSKALTPAVPWKGSSIPAPPTDVKLSKESSKMKLTIIDKNGNLPRKYVIYRFEGTKEGSYEDPESILDVVYSTKGNTVYVDSTANKSSVYTYGVKSVSHTGVESKRAFVLKDGITDMPTPGLFKDISSKHRGFKEITYLAQGDIVSGDTQGYYNPDRQVTRAEAMAMIGRSLNLDGTRRKTTFKDVNANSFASGYIQSAVDKKVISGYNDGTFKPDAPLTRGEMALMISRTFDYDYNNSTSGAAKALITRGIAVGFEDGTFGADKKIIRSDYAIFLARAIDFTLRLTSPPISFDREMTVNMDSCPINKGPSDKFAQAGTLKRNEKVSIGYHVGSWTLIKSSANVVGFVPHSSLK
ncbi:family 10 glycosylhydrolase [Sporosarcina gallistercoris]|uniref:family 10 glycosylhydrolase n=1 Tax=Sporosarcina gallistercoris TaxID=2762245 RepID=UPI003D2A5963